MIVVTHASCEQKDPPATELDLCRGAKAKAAAQNKQSLVLAAGMQRDERTREAEMSELITELWATAERLANGGHTDDPTNIALAIEHIEQQAAEIERLRADFADARSCAKVWEQETQRARADERTAMYYLDQIRRAVAPDVDFPTLVQRCGEIQQERDQLKARSSTYDAEVIEQMLSNMLYEKGMTASHYKCVELVRWIRSYANKLRQHAKNGMSFKCKNCGDDSTPNHMHDTAHGMEGTHIAGSERFECKGCGKELTKPEADAAGLKFVLDVD